jgi:cellulose synthase/poly-beta-1,6-N-acetylglucosamine synthase-like glycosyltransferase
MWTALFVFHVIVFGYFIVLNTYYFVMSLVAFGQLRRYNQRLRVSDLSALEGIPPATLIVPAFNEERTCLEAARSFLSLDYPEYEVMLVNDGSTDGTLEVLHEAYDLQPASRFPTSSIETAEVRGVFQSATHPNLWVIDKKNGGRSDAINAGISYCRTPLFCAVDADGILEDSALLRVVRPFLEDERTVASGGIIRIANGCKVDEGRVDEVRLPEGWLGRFQVLEYLRSFLAGRVGWDALRVMFLISGAFGMFRRDIVAELGGLDPNSIGEDLELTVRLHRYCRERDLPYRIAFVPDPVAWTEAPDTINILANQRDRWQRGLIDTMFLHRDMLLNPKYGRIGLVAYPYFFFLEMLGPVIELAGYVVFALLLAFGLVSMPLALAFVLVSIVLGTILSVLSVVLEEVSFRRYERFSDLLWLFGLAVLENLGYRQLQTYFRCRGTWSYLRGVEGWGAMERRGFDGSAS